MDENFWFKKAIQSILSQNKSDIEKTEEIMEIINDIQERNKLLMDLASDQFKLLRFINKVMYDITKHQRTMSREEQNFELLDLSWSTNDCISDNPEQMELIEILKTKGIDITK